MAEGDLQKAIALLEYALARRGLYLSVHALNKVKEVLKWELAGDRETVRQWGSRAFSQADPGDQQSGSPLPVLFRRARISLDYRRITDADRVRGRCRQDRLMEVSLSACCRASV